MSTLNSRPSTTLQRKRKGLVLSRDKLITSSSSLHHLTPSGRSSLLAKETVDAVVVITTASHPEMMDDVMTNVVVARTAEKAHIGTLAGLTAMGLAEAVTVATLARALALALRAETDAIVPDPVIAALTVRHVVQLAPSAARNAPSLRTDLVTLVALCSPVEPTLMVKGGAQSEDVTQVHERSAALVIMVTSLSLRIVMPL